MRAGLVSAFHCCIINIYKVHEKQTVHIFSLREWMVLDGRTGCTEFTKYRDTAAGELQSSRLLGPKMHWWERLQELSPHCTKPGLHQDPTLLWQPPPHQGPSCCPSRMTSDFTRAPEFQIITKWLSAPQPWRQHWKASFCLKKNPSSGEQPRPRHTRWDSWVGRENAVCVSMYVLPSWDKSWTTQPQIWQVTHSSVSYRGLWAPLWELECFV
jgi:hypothetical protein